jgi:putative heme-binding domain-containing protein
MIYRGNGLPPEYYGDAFACDPTGNLVHRDKLQPVGPTFASRMATEGREFLASPDNWFRPVNLSVGPDGALYICDMYRKTIEHPEYLPVEVRKRTDFESGKDKGRIWRVVSATGKNNTAQTLDLETLPAAQLVKLLAHSNIWHRDTARRLILEKKPREIFSLLLNELPEFATEPDFARLPRATNNPARPGPHLARINALDMLFALGGGRALMTQDKKEIERYFQGMFAAWGFEPRDDRAFFSRLLRATWDESPGVRRAAFRLFTAFPGQGPDVGGDLLQFWADDPSPQARFQIALFFTNTEWSETFSPLARIARRDGADRWTRAAVLSGLKGRANHFFETLIRQTNSVPAPEMMRELCKLEVHPFTAVLALTDAEASERLFGVPQVRGESDAGWQIAGLAGLVEGLRARAGGKAVPKLIEYTDKPFGDSPGWKSDGRHLRELITRAENLLMDAQEPVVVRTAAITLLVSEEEAEAAPMLLRLLKPGELLEVQQAAIRALASIPGNQALGNVLSADRWREFSPDVRGAVLGSLLAQPRHIELLLGKLESGAIPAIEISRSQRDRLLKQKDEGLRLRAEKLFAKAGGDRMKVFAENKAILQLTSESQRGREIFKTHCASCHRLEREGFSVGPDIFGMRNQPKEAILLHLLVPNHEINPGFVAYEIETHDGRSLTGLIASETATSLTLRQPQGIEETLRRADIASLKATALSLMPDELEKAMSRQDLADLLAFLKGE